MTTLAEKDFKKEIETPKVELERIIGKPVESFVYPYGVLDDTDIMELKK